MDNYQHTLKCPECGKRKVYISDDGTTYYCKACGHSWRVD